WARARGAPLRTDAPRANPRPSNLRTNALRTPLRTDPSAPLCVSTPGASLSTNALRTAPCVPAPSAPLCVPTPSANLRTNAPPVGAPRTNPRPYQPWCQSARRHQGARGTVGVWGARPPRWHSERDPVRALRGHGSPISVALIEHLSSARFRTNLDRLLS